MKPIVKPPHRPRSDGADFAHCAYRARQDNPFELPMTRFTDVPREVVPYIPDAADRAFLERCNTMHSFEPPLTRHMLCILIAALETHAALKLRELWEANKRSQQAPAAAGGKQQSQQQRGGGVGGGTAGALTICPGNRDILQQIKIDVADTLRNAHFDNKHPCLSDRAMAKSIFEAVHGHWLEKRVALGTALIPTLCPNAVDSGGLANRVLGQDDEPFVDREINDVLVVWRESPEHVIRHAQEKQGAGAGNAATIIANAKKNASTSERDVATSRRFLQTARALMKAVVEREELRLAHLEVTIAELALSRRCRQLPPTALSAASSAAGTPISAAKQRGGGGTSVANQLQQQFQAAQQLVPLVDWVPSDQRRRSGGGQQQPQFPSLSGAARGITTNVSDALDGLVLLNHELEPVVDELVTQLALFGE